MNTTSLTDTKSETQKDDPVRKRRRLSYAEKINLAKVLTEAINKNMDQLSAVGITEDFAKELDEQRKAAESLNIEQEKLKADLKSKTNALRIEMIKLGSLFSRGKKLVKIQVPSVQWKEFGIADKK